MKKLTIVAAMALTATTAFAGDHSIKGIARMSWKHVDDDVNSTPNTSIIKAEYANLNFAGKLTGNTNYYLELNLAATSDAANNDGTADYLDAFGVERTLAEGLTLNIGKQGLLVGGVEVGHAAEDQYITSYYFDQADGLTNELGLTLSKEMMGHTLSLQYTNGNAEDRSGKQSQYGWAAHLAGNFGNGMVKPMIGYTVRPGGDTNQDKTLMGLGAELNVIPNMQLDLDYGLVTAKKGFTVTKDQKSNTLAVLASYTGHELVTPFVKYFKDTKKTNNDGSKKEDVTGMGLGVEYREAKVDPIRWHAAYTSKETKPVTGAKTKEIIMTVGAKFEANIL